MYASIKPVSTGVGLTVGIDCARDVPTSADEVSSTGLSEGGGYDDGEGGVLAPLVLDLRLGLGVDAGTLGKVASAISRTMKSASSRSAI